MKKQFKNARFTISKETKIESATYTCCSSVKNHPGTTLYKIFAMKSFDFEKIHFINLLLFFCEYSPKLVNYSKVSETIRRNWFC